MKYVFAFIVLVHGLIHLMGFSKAFGVGQITSLTRDISKQTGAIWLLAALLFLIAGTGYLFKRMVACNRCFWCSGFTDTHHPELAGCKIWNDSQCDHSDDGHDEPCKSAL